MTAARPALGPREAVDAAIGRDLLGPGTIVVAVSGGVDSVALLDALAAVGPARGLRLLVAHLDHGLRRTSGGDRDFVAHLATRLGLPFHEGRADVAARATRERRGIEETARAARYEFLASALRDRGALAVATGHTADDQVETILLHVIRGSATRGLRGMAAFSRQPVGDLALPIWRPLLAVGRSATERYCLEQGLAWREDESNRDRHFTRNRVRHELLPLLRELNPGVDRALLSLAELAGADEDALEAELDRVWPTLAPNARTARIEWPDAAGVTLAVAPLAALPLALRRRVLLRAVRLTAPGAPAPGHERIDATIALLHGRIGATIELPGGARVKRGYSSLLVTAAPGRGDDPGESTA